MQDTMRQGDGIGVALACGSCGQPASADHNCSPKQEIKEDEQEEKE